MIFEERKVNYQNGFASTIRTKAPLRISFAGGGTDVPPYPESEGGCVLNATIDNYAWGSLRPREDGRIRIESVDLGLSLDYPVDSELKLDGQLDLVKATIVRLRAKFKGFDVFCIVTPPVRFGLIFGLNRRAGWPCQSSKACLDGVRDRIAYLIEREDLQ